MARVTIKDIARELGLNVSTVSRALRNHPDISDETKKKVREVADRLNYFPDSHAQSLQTGYSKTIGVIVPEIRHHFFSSVISGIEDVAYSEGYTIMVCQSNEREKREEINIKALLSHRVAGLLVSISQETKKADHFKLVKKMKVPLVFFDRIHPGVSASKVVVNDYQGAFQAVAYLIERGYKKIAHIGGPANLNISQERLRGYRDAILQAGLEWNSELVCVGGLHEQDGEKGIEYLIRKNQTIEAVFCINDPVAVGVYTFARRKKLRIPDDLAVVGFSNNPIAALIEPPLTTVHQPSYEMGKTAAKVLLDHIKDPTEPEKTIILEPSLIKRSSA